jgi:hypothetical protein
MRRNMATRPDGRTAAHLPESSLGSSGRLGHFLQNLLALAGLSPRGDARGKQRRDREKNQRTQAPRFRRLSQLEKAEC